LGSGSLLTSPFGAPAAAAALPASQQQQRTIVSIQSESQQSKPTQVQKCNALVEQLVRFMRF
jgi:hypothetical protein